MSKAKAKSTAKVPVAAVVGLLLFLICAAYSNHFENGFHFDDGHTIVENAAIRDLRNIPLFFQDATTFSSLPSNQSYRPLVSTLLAIDYRLAHGLHPFWFHVSIFTLFLALTLLLALVVDHLLARVYDSPNRRWIALSAAGLYALLPANADAINYIVVSSEVIATLGVVASFALYFVFPQRRRYFLFVFPAAIAILAKPIAAIFPALFALFLVCFPDHKERSARPARLFEGVLPFLICGAVLLFVQQMTPRSWVGGATSMSRYLATQPYVALLYFKTFFLATGLSADYDLKPFLSLADPSFWIGCAFLFGLGAAATVAALSRRTRLIGFGLLWFLIALLPTSLFPLAEVMNDYRTFLPFIGLAITLAGLIALLVPHLERTRRRIKVTAIGTFVFILCWNAHATFERNKVWRNEETLWHDVVLKSPQNERGLLAYGIQLMNRGDFPGALAYFHRAEQLAPRYAELLLNLAIAENATHESDLAERHFQEALRLAPSQPDSYVFYARYLLAHSRLEEAQSLLRRALELSPGDLTARELLDDSEKHAVEIHTRVADTYLRHGKFSLAAAEYEAALKTPPHLGSTLNNFAWLLSTCPDASLRNGARAVELAQEADRLADGESPLFLRTLAAAFAEAKQFPEALATAQRASGLALAQGNGALAQRLDKDTSFYREGRPLH